MLGRDGTYCKKLGADYQASIMCFSVWALGTWPHDMHQVILCVGSDEVPRVVTAASALHI